MKKFLLFIFIFSGVLTAQKVTVTKIKQITTPEQGKFYHPVGNYDDTKILFSSDNYKGLWIFDNITGKISKINDYISAGYNADFTKDGEVISRNDNFLNNRRFISVMKYNPVTKTETTLVENLRGVSEIKLIRGEAVAYSKEKQVVTEFMNNKLNKIDVDKIPILLVENSNLVLYKGGKRKVLNPLGEGNYIWASVSPNGSRLLFTLVGVGSFVTDLNGTVLTELGYAHFPQWSKDGNWITFMKDYDDGEKVIDSELYVASADGKTIVNITNTKDVYEMYPQWSKIGNAIYCNSTEGIIYKIELKFN